MRTNWARSSGAAAAKQLILNRARGDKSAIGVSAAPPGCRLPASGRWPNVLIEASQPCLLAAKQPQEEHYMRPRGSKPSLQIYKNNTGGRPTAPQRVPLYGGSSSAIRTYSHPTAAHLIFRSPARGSASCDETVSATAVKNHTRRDPKPHAVAARKRSR